MRKTYASGFTLIELVVAVTVVGILSAIAYPAYTNYVKRSNRTDAEAQLTRLAQAQERWISVKDTYASTASSLVAMGAVTVSPANAQGNSSVKVLYNLSTTFTTNLAYTVTATPNSTGLNKSDGNITLTSTGKKCWYKNAGSTCYDWTQNN